MNGEDEYYFCSKTVIKGSLSARNAAAWKGVFQDHWHVKRRVGSALNDRERAQTVVQRTHQPALLVPWSRPPEGTLKINVDGACFSTDYVGVGCVIRDCNGAFIGALQNQKSFSGALEPRFVELLAIHEALSWIKREGWHLVTVESDALDCVRAVLDSNYVDDFNFGLFVFDCKSLLSELRDVNLSYVRRSANDTAHRLARACFMETDPVVWVVSPPPCISDSFLMN
ncbi:uncharacterized protein LOC119369912 [Jatropha curcas]|uniref:uncharacterized protein LOC119369912 n=1 Tax=Jatropha curcas TaxID=180498 RepID=UPI0018950363|nr:uncharacterized protein LOC119369912 [Jatropha curcas]